MRKPNVWMIICIFAILVVMSLIHLSNHHVNNEIKIDEIATDLAILLMIFISFIYTRNKYLQIILLVFSISPDVLSYGQITHGHYIYLSYAISYLLAGILTLTLFPQYKMTTFSFIIMSHYQLFMAIAYYLADGLKIYEIAQSFMFVNYKAFLYGIHLLIIGSITKWTIIDRIRIHIDYYIRILRIKLGAYFVS